MKINFQKIPLLLLIITFSLFFVLSINHIGQAKSYNIIAQDDSRGDGGGRGGDRGGRGEGTGSESAAEPISTGGYLFTEEDNPLQSKTISQFLDKLFSAIQPIVLLLAVFFIILSGFQFVRAQGEPTKVKEAQTNIKWTIVGVAIVTGAKFLIDVISDLLSGL